MTAAEKIFDGKYDDVVEGEDEGIDVPSGSGKAKVRSP